MIVAVFLFTYVGMALGRVPGLRIDRTGIALVAVAALLVFGAIEIADIGAAQHLPTLMLLFALMIVSAQFAAAGFYDACAHLITVADLSPRLLLALTIAVGGTLSAVLANDVVVFAMTPLLCHGLRARRLDPRPFLVGLAGASNAGSAATLIGNPQNILIGQIGGLDFWHFVWVCGPPAAAATLIVFLTVCVVWRRELQAVDTMPDAVTAPSVDRAQTVKGLLAVAALIVLFTTPLPHAVSALVLAALLLVSRYTASRDLVGAVDWQLLLLFACLFTVTAAFAGTGLGEAGLAWLRGAGLAPNALAGMAPLALLLSNGIGNVPAVILITSVWQDAGPGALYGLALMTTLAGNLLLVGSFANLIVAERAKSVGVTLGFIDFARAGIPMALISMAVAAAWLAWGGWMPLIP